MMSVINQGTVLLPLFMVVSGCAGWDNPTALADLDVDVEFEIDAAELQTFEEFEVHVRARESGSPMTMRQARLEVEPASGGPTMVFDMEPEGDGYAAHVTFFEAGEHHLHFNGRPKGHNLMVEMGEDEVEVHRRHQVIGPYWVELAVTPAPIVEGDGAHIHLFAFELLGDGTRGDPVGGLEIELEVASPDDIHTVVEIGEEEEGEYEGAHRFGEAGLYELHVEIEVGTEHEEGEFNLPVLSVSGEQPGGGEGGHGHGG